jgi:hypothetical protein
MAGHDRKVDAYSKWLRAPSPAMIVAVVCAGLVPLVAPTLLILVLCVVTR